ncbi:MAG: GDSL-type esterase/lipase family protein [Verrucomicrobia bacterium]|nr:GDSL-type esterase/lipase family protein [Verrucomicrobiota bacterium]
MTKRLKNTLFMFLAAGLVSVFALGVGEVLARIWVAKKWTVEKKVMILNDDPMNGRYVYHPDIGYVLSPGYDDHNSLGWRGAEFELEKPAGTWRVVCLGGSTTYGTTASTAYPAFLEELLREEGIEAEVINAGVPGWTSRESRINFELRVLPLDPDLVIIYHGRNDLIPQAYNGYQNDYSHYRIRLITL